MSFCLDPVTGSWETPHDPTTYTYLCAIAAAAAAAVAVAAVSTRLGGRERDSLKWLERERKRAQMS